jgi:hypothetical protein
MEPGTGSPIVEGIFYGLVVVLIITIGLALARTTFLVSLLWLMPLARFFSFVPGVRAWVARKTQDVDDGAVDATGGRHRDS